MPSSPNFGQRGCLKPIEAWVARLRTVRGMGLLCLAWLMVAAVPFRLWRGWLGGRRGDLPDCTAAQRLAAQIERATWRLPITVKCLPQAAALSWQLRRRGIRHCLVLAVRPLDTRRGGDDLHAWIECDSAIVLGQLPGPWAKIHVLGEP